MTDSAIWLTCRDCGHTTRILALLASRVMETRTHCLECHSMREPSLNSTPVGRAISISAEQSAALREMDDQTVRAWIQASAGRADALNSPLQRMRSAASRLVDRFAHSGMGYHAPLAKEFRGSGRRSEAAGKAIPPFMTPVQ